ncbi:MULTISPECIES: DUF3263 domain-containing protein [Rothia]|jgi:DNA-directed RNA polymerase, beta subunit|uniref:DUF3263 domain-containing protein n=1 Tax=Rothia TaxID=32207 RepID=UPI00066AA47A|nr:MULTISPECIES: DUF3263 domain-containing protein [Rothia]MBS4946621.1 DUF3263 domain-containing protein [Rothia mucilaginosa]OHP74502.1 DNA-directed RNA polymerase subunit beta [Rothia sp. HMSC062F03]
MPEQEHTEAVQSETPENKTPGKTESPAETSAETPVRAETQSDELNDGLNPLERRILALERRGFKHQGSKEKAIKALGFTPIAYYQMLNVMLDDERVREAAPRLVDALRARRDAD